jgi:methylglutaconyl-CoA hydratase
MSSYRYLSVEHSFQKRIATVMIRRPEVHNAFNTQVIQELTAAFTELPVEEQLHGIVLTGEGASFSAGADVQMMKDTVTFTHEQNIEDAFRLAKLMQTIYSCQVPVIARVNGAAIGGGIGLVAACDIAIAADNARFAFSEVKLGIAPAVISPYALRKIGEAQARALFVTGERFSAERALSIGLVHTIVPLEQLDDAVQKTVRELLSSAPQAIRACKELALHVGSMDEGMAREFTAKTIARLRTSDEGQEGLSAFLEKRKPNWLLSEA